MKARFLAIYKVLRESGHRDNIGAAREPSAYVRRHLVSQSQSISPNSAMERCATGARLGLEVDGWKTASNYNAPATST